MPAIDGFSRIDDVSLIADAPLNPGQADSASVRAADLVRRVTGRGAFRRLGRTDRAALLVLLFDGHIGVERQGRILLGISAIEALGLRAHLEMPQSPVLPGTLAALSYGEHLFPLAVDDLAMRLYAYGTQPLTPQIAARFPTSHSVREQLGMRSVEVRVRSAQWRAPAPTAGDRWAYWSRADLRNPRDSTLYKLFVGVDLNELSRVLRLVSRVAPEERAVAFKIGADIPGILRPDRLVVYFRRRAQLEKAASRLATELASAPGSLVPFTATFEQSTVLSWGIDFPRTSGGSSWRVHVTRRLAGALSIARRTSTDSSAAIPYALNRLRLDGVDPATMTPLPGTRRWSA